VKVLDLNVLVYATDAASAHHPTAKPWLDAAISSSETIGIPTLVAVGYLRITTNPRVMNAPLDADRAMQILSGWFSRPNVTSPAPTDRHYALMSQILAKVGTAGNLVTDAHLAALSIEHGAELCSYDHDFGRFAGVVWVNPLDGQG
jgi:hypothetical protein